MMLKSEVSDFTSVFIFLGQLYLKRQGNCQPHSGSSREGTLLAALWEIMSTNPASTELRMVYAFQSYNC